MTAFQMTTAPRWQSFERRARPIAGALFIAALLLPGSAWGMDSSPKTQASDVRKELVLPPVSDAHWMNWKPSQPVLKIDTLLAPGNDPSEGLSIPFEYGHRLPRTS